jgi:nicotinamidase-related amidase
MDVQTNILSRLEEKQAQSLIDRLQEAIAAARRAGLPVIYAVVGFRKGVPEISWSNKMFGRIKNDSAALAAVGQPVAIAPGIAPREEDIVVTKKRVSAFTGSDLEIILRASKVEHLVLAGIATSGVVLSTVREAADKDFRLTVLSDGCADTDPEVHTVLLTKVFPRQADVMTVGEWIGEEKS